MAYPRISTSQIGSLRTSATLFALIALALVLRVPGLDAPLWYDEILALVESVRPDLGSIVTTYHDSNHHPLFATLSHVSVSLFGERPWAVRLPAVIFGIAGVPALYLLGRLVANRREAAIASLLLATSYHHIWFSQNARGYSALLFFTILATWSLLKGLREQKRVWFLVYGIAVALGAYTHLTLVFVVIAHAAICGWIVLRTSAVGFGGAAWRLPLTGFCVAGGLTLLLYAPMARSLYTFLGDATYPPAHFVTPAVSVRHAIDSLQIGMHTIGALLAMALGLIGAIDYVKHQTTTAALFVLPSIGIAAGARLVGTPLRPRFFFLLIGFAMLFIVRGAACLAAWSTPRFVTRHRAEYASAGTMALALIMVAVAVPSILYNYRLPKQDFESARSYIAARRASHEPVVTAGTAVYPFERYYRERWYGVSTIDQFEVIRSRHPEFWVVYSQPEYLQPTLRTAIEQSCATSKVFQGTLGGGDVVVCATSGASHVARRSVLP